MAKNNEKYAYLDRLSTEQLEELLRADIESPENSDEGVIFHILEVIEQRKQMDSAETLPNVDLAWKEFQQYYNVPEGKDQSLYPFNPIANNSDTTNETALHIMTAPTSLRLRRIFKHGLAAVIAIVALLGGMVVAQAAGIDVFGLLGRWTEETFSFVSNEQAEASIPNTFASIAPEHVSYYTEMQRAAADCGIIEEIAPAWYPIGFDTSTPETMSTDISDSIISIFSHEDGRNFSVCITHNKSSLHSASYTFEKDESSVEPYTHGGKTFYILSNIDSTTATWSNGNLLITISGNLTTDEVKTMIDSIGGL